MMQDDFKTTAVPVSAATFMSMVGVGMMIPAMPLLSAQAGSAGVAAGALMGAYGFSRLLCNALSGVLTDRFGVARSATAGLLLLAADSVFGSMANHFATLLAVMVIQGAASSLFSTAAMTALVLKGGPKSRGRALAWFQTALLLALALGPVIGGELVDRFGAHAPFAAQAVIAVLALYAVRAMPRQASAAAGRPGMPSSSLTAFLGRALVVGGLCAFAAFFCRFGVSWNLVPVAALQRFHLSTRELGWIIGAGTVANLLVLPFLGKLVDGWGARPTLVTAAALNIAGLLALFAAPGITMLWVATAIVMLATGIMLPAAGALATRDATPATMGRTMGLYRTIGESGMAFGPVVVPAVSAALDWPLLNGLLTCAAVSAVAIAATFLMGRAKPAPTP